MALRRLVAILLPVADAVGKQIRKLDGADCVVNAYYIIWEPTMRANRLAGSIVVACHPEITKLLCGLNKDDWVEGLQFVKVLDGDFWDGLELKAITCAGVRLQTKPRSPRR